MWRVKAAVCCVLGLISLCADARAVVLDWDTAAWTDGAVTGGVELDATKAGTEVNFVISGNLNKLRPDPGTGRDTPAITNTLQGGTGQQSLNFTANVGTQTEITVDVSFSLLYTMGAKDVSFTLFDIDKTTDSEFIKNIWGVRLDGTLVPAVISDRGAVVQLSGTGTSQLLTGTAAADNLGSTGNATISFGSEVIRSFTFTFDNSSGPPRIQEFAMGDLNFTPVPEINPALAGALSCVAATGLLFFHRARVKSRRQ